MSFESAEQIADALLYEGYVLYPYRASALKNRFRWQFGVVVPRGYSEADSSERWFTQTECLVELERRAALTIKVRFLQIEARTIEIPCDRLADTWCATDGATVGDDEPTAWDDAVERAVVVHLSGPPPSDEPMQPSAGARRPDLLEGHLDTDPTGSGTSSVFPFEIPGGQDIHVRHDPSGRAAARVVRERWPISGRIFIGATACGPLWKLTIRVENATSWDGVADRAVALRQSLLGVHTLLAVENGGFLSMEDPPDGLRELARSCINVGSWPVLEGSAGSRDVILASPIILSDYPAIAPESTGNLFDATEIDELLTLRVMTLTDREKREARATDERTRRMLDRTDATSAEALARLHGAVRDVESISSVAEYEAARPRDGQSEWEALLNPPSEAAPEHATLDIPGLCVTMGSRVRLKPQRCADPIDIFLGGRIATVMAVYRTLENQPYVAVTVDDDPGADLRRATGRYFYFSADEIVAIEPDGDGR